MKRFRKKKNLNVAIYYVIWVRGNSTLQITIIFLLHIETWRENDVSRFKNSDCISIKAFLKINMKNDIHCLIFAFYIINKYTWVYVESTGNYLFFAITQYIMHDWQLIVTEYRNMIDLHDWLHEVGSYIYYI